MKKSRYTEEQIVGILKESEAGLDTGELWRVAPIPTTLPNHNHEGAPGLASETGERSTLSLTNLSPRIARLDGSPRPSGRESNAQNTRGFIPDEKQLGPPGPTPRCQEQNRATILFSMA